MGLVSFSYRSFSFKTKVNFLDKKHHLSVAYSSLYSRSSPFLADMKFINSNVKTIIFCIEIKKLNLGRLADSRDEL
jgi:hypothetical protein